MNSANWWPHSAVETALAEGADRFETCIVIYRTREAQTGVLIHKHCDCPGCNENNIEALEKLLNSLQSLRSQLRH